MSSFKPLKFGAMHKETRRKQILRAFVLLVYSCNSLFLAFEAGLHLAGPSVFGEGPSRSIGLEESAGFRIFAGSVFAVLLVVYVVKVFQELRTCCRLCLKRPISLDVSKETTVKNKLLTLLGEFEIGYTLHTYLFSPQFFFPNPGFFFLQRKVLPCC